MLNIVIDFTQMAFYGYLTFKEPNNTTTTVPAYTTPISGGVALTLANGNKVYCVLGKYGSANATKILYDTNRNVLCNPPKTEYTKKQYTTPGTFTWTCPLDITKVRVAVVGGGAGCLMVTDHSQNYGVKAGDGGTSSFGNLIQATGGKGWAFNKDTDPNLWYEGMVIPASYAGVPNGTVGYIRHGDHNDNPWNYGKGFTLSFTKTFAEYTITQGTGGYGKGGYGYMGNPDNENYCATGCSGGYNVGLFTVVPGDTYQIKVGAGGNGFVKDTSVSDGCYAHNGNGGYVLMEYGPNVK